MKRKFVIFLFICLVTFSLLGCDDTNDEVKVDTFCIIGTGDITGIYFQTGGSIQSIVNLNKEAYNIRCTVESTNGSVFNINQVTDGKLDFAVVQSDRQFQAINGEAEWLNTPKKDLRSIFALHHEAVTLVAAVDSGINKVEDLRGKRVNIGNEGSGQRQNAIDVLEYFGIDYKKDIKSESMIPLEIPKSLQKGEIDAFFYTVGQPNNVIKEATIGERKVKIIPISDVKGIVKKHPYYTKTTILRSLYPDAVNTEDITTFGVRGTFVTSADKDETLVYNITKIIMENFDDFKETHPAYADLTKENMLTGLTAEIHPGALKYYKEVGLK